MTHTDTTAPRPAAVAAGRADLPLPAALRVLLQPGGLRALQGEELDTDDWLRVLREGRETGRRATGPVGRRAAAARRPGSDRRRGAAPGLLHATCSPPAWASRPNGARAAAEGRGPGSRAAVVPGQHARDERLPLAHQDLRAEEPRREDHQGPGLADGDERGDPPPEHRPHRPHHRAWRHELGAEYIELANTQYYSWAFVNRAQLLPTREQLVRAEAVTNEWRKKLEGIACASSSSRPTTTRAAPRSASTAGAACS